MSELLIGGGAAAGTGALWWMWRVQRLRRISRARLNEDVVGKVRERYVVTLQPTLRRHPILPWAIGAGIGVALHFLLGLGVVYCLALGTILGTIGFIIEQQIAGRRSLKIEMQLANAIDLMVGALGAGAGVTEAIESSARESHKPLKQELQEVLGRIRYGEAPAMVWEDFIVRIPLETFRLFSFTMAVHGEVGGSLAPTLSTVGKSIRDRIEISRRIRAQSTEAQASVVGIVGITYFLALMMWRTNPHHFEEFLKHPLGQNFVAGAMIFQAVGLLWITKLSQLKF